MAPKNLIDRYENCDSDEKMILALLALNRASLGKTALTDHLRHAGIKHRDGRAYNAATIGPNLERLVKQGLTKIVNGGGHVCVEALVWPAIRSAMMERVFDPLCEAIESLNNVPDYYYYRITYQQQLGRLQMALLRGQPQQDVNRWLELCEGSYEAKERHPLITLCGAPFNPEMIERFHPGMQQVVLAFFLSHTDNALESGPAILKSAEQLLEQTGTAEVSAAFVTELAESFMLCGRLDDAWGLIEKREGSIIQFLRASILLLRGDHAGAVSAFEAALKTARKKSGKRHVFIEGVCGYLYVVAMMRCVDPKMHKQADTYLEQALRSGYPYERLAVYFQLQTLRLVQGGTSKPEAALDRDNGKLPLAQMFYPLLLYWLGLPQLNQHEKQLVELLARTDKAGLHLISAQVAGLLGRIGKAPYAERAKVLRKQYGLTDAADWFERQEPWQRQLTALINLQQGGGSGAGSAKKEAQTRLVWMLSYDPAYGMTQVEPREQKCDARGHWTKGRPVALKRLREEPGKIDFLTPQDLRVCAAISDMSHYYGGVRYELNPKRAVAALVGHPLAFWLDAPAARVELLHSEPEILIKESGGKLTLSLQPTITTDSDNVLITKETPTRLRVLSINEEHRRIAAIIGNGLSVPAQAKEKVLQAISAISSLVTVQSDIGGGASNVEQIDADQRLHVHLLPHQLGLRMQVLVRPLADGGPYYAPGHGAENVIAEVAGKPLQARRDLAGESRAEQQCIAACPALTRAEQAHGEWLLNEPEDCLELLLQLQDQAPGSIVLAWPEGEKFKVGARLGFKQFRLSIMADKDWFAAGGTLQVDEGKVLDLRQLLELLNHSQGRFLALGNNEFLALTEEFHRRLSDLTAFGELHGNGARVHPLAAFALEELADEAHDSGRLKADKAWKQHLARLQEVETLTPQLPGTLQAELRDYQLAGFEWLARLAHWGVGACLADDMGLGKTLQALALILDRAPQGPALVVAPTSVCMNWMSEIARFAPTLKVMLFGAGDRKEALTTLQPFDLVIASYGLLQQEAELFAGVQWHTIVLDEAQAIKNAQTKRSQAVMALSGAFRMAATGTPLENHLGELWNLFRFINPGLLGSLDQFNQRFANPIERGQDKAAQSAARTHLKRLIQPFILRRTKTQVLSELPSRTEIVLQIDLSAEERALYETLRRTALERLAAVNETSTASAGQKSIQILAEIMRLRRACCNPQLVAPELGLASSKLAAFAELLDELLLNRHKVLVFSQFVDHLNLIRAHLDQRAIQYQYLDGATPMQQRKIRVDAFQAGDGDVFLISLKAGGIGINLTAADYVIHMDPWWNPAVEDQASDRAHRMGQLRPVTIYRLVARHTIEESIVNLHKHKRDLADSLLEGSDLAARMSAREMMAMLQEGLQKDAR
ncbi:MAG: DEAD/DEAH box helicase [Herminiimonas sp.]|nr:DEAD/DEAH box helicase [Herminiimonas sp.]